MNGPAGVMSLVLAETAAGAIGFLFLTPLWSEVRRGFFFLVGAIALALALGTAAAARAGYDPRASGGRSAPGVSLALAAATLLWLLLLAARREVPARIVGILCVPLALGMLFAFARAADESVGLAFFQLLAGAAFTGAVLDGLLLGHWYLTDRKLTRGPINRMTLLLGAAVAIDAAAVIAGAFGSQNQTQAASNALNPLLSISGSASLIAIGMVVCTGLIAVFIRLTLRGSRAAAVQSATGFFYLAVITAFVAELAAKIKFLP
jgi:hypothetical protein